MGRILKPISGNELQVSDVKIYLYLLSSNLQLMLPISVCCNSIRIILLQTRLYYLSCILPVYAKIIITFSCLFLMYYIVQRRIYEKLCLIN